MVPCLLGRSPSGSTFEFSDVAVLDLCPWLCSGRLGTHGLGSLASASRPGAGASCGHRHPLQPILRTAARSACSQVTCGSWHLSVTLELCDPQCLCPALGTCWHPEQSRGCEVLETGTAEIGSYSRILRISLSFCYLLKISLLGLWVFFGMFGFVWFLSFIIIIVIVWGLCVAFVF